MFNLRLCSCNLFRDLKRDSGDLRTVKISKNYVRPENEGDGVTRTRKMFEKWQQKKSCHFYFKYYFFKFILKFIPTLEFEFIYV